MNTQIDLPDFGARLKDVAGRFGGVRALARISGVAYGTLQKYVRKKNPVEPGLGALEKILRATKADGTWLITGESGTLDQIQADNSATHPNFPEFDLNIYLKHLHGDTVKKRLIDRLRFDYSKIPFPIGNIPAIRSNFPDEVYPTKSRRAKALVSYKIQTTEMVPTFPMGHTVLVDLSDCEVDSDFFLVIRHTRESLIARVNKIEVGDGEEVFFCTPHCRPRTFTLQEIHQKSLIIGRVTSIAFEDPKRLPLS